MTYRYSILSLQPNLQNAASRIPFAVLVEGARADINMLAYVGQDPPITEDMSVISQSVARNSKELLNAQIERYIHGERKQHASLLDYLAENNRWSFQISKPKDIPSHLRKAFNVESASEQFESIEMAFILFYKFIAPNDLMLNQLLSDGLTNVSRMSVNVLPPRAEFYPASVLASRYRSEYAMA